MWEMVGFAMFEPMALEEWTFPNGDGWVRATLAYPARLNRAYYQQVSIGIYGFVV